MWSNANVNCQNLEKIWQGKKGKVYSNIWTRSIPFHTQEPKHSDTAVIAAGTIISTIYRQTLHNPAPPTITLPTIHNPAPDLPAPPIRTVHI